MALHLASKQVMPFAFAVKGIPFGKASLSKIVICSNAFALPNCLVVVTSLAAIGMDHPSKITHALPFMPCLRNACRLLHGFYPQPIFGN